MEEIRKQMSPTLSESAQDGSSFFVRQKFVLLISLHHFPYLVVRPFDFSSENPNHITLLFTLNFMRTYFSVIGPEIDTRCCSSMSLVSRGTISRLCEPIDLFRWK